MRPERSGFPAVFCKAATIACLALSSAAYSGESEIPAQSWVGHWSGVWTELGSRGLSGPYQLMIEKVEGGQVAGNAEIIGRRVSVPPFRVQGTLSGKSLQYGSGVKTSLTLEGGMLSGTTTGARDDVRIELRKKD